MKTTNFILKSSMVAAIYAGLTFFLAPISFGPIQFRLSEVLILLVLIEPRYIWGLTIGTVIANLFSPLGLMDVYVGGSATLISLFLMIKTENIYKAAIFPCLINGLFIGAEISYISGLEFFSGPFWLISSQVFLGELGVLYLVGIPILRYLQTKRRDVISIMKI